MDKKGLLVEPDFADIDKYLSSGQRTYITEEIKEVANTISGDTDGIIVRNIILWMNQHTKRLHNGKDYRKFKRTATEILQSGERTGCCDSTTLFLALARSKGIPSMQIITFCKDWGNTVDKGEKTKVSGHYFVACYLKDINGKFSWNIIDADKPINDIRDVPFYRLDTNNRNITRNHYAFAYVKDYADVNYKGLKIDSIENMAKIQLAAYKMCNRSNFIEKDEGFEH